MGKQQKIYTREFKVEAVQLVKSSGSHPAGARHFKTVGAMITSPELFSPSELLTQRDSTHADGESDRV